MSELGAVLRAAGLRSRTTIGDRAYLVYLTILVGIIVVAPVGRALWLLACAPEAVAAITALPVLGAVGVAALGLLGGQLVGSVWPTVVRTPFLTSVLAQSAFIRRRAFAGPTFRVLALGALLGVATAGLIVGGPLAWGAILPSTALLAGASLTLLGVAISAAMILGQSVGPRGRAAAALACLVALGTIVAAGVAPGTSWLAVGPSIALLISLAVCAGALTMFAVASIERMPTDALIRASVRAATLRDSAILMDAPAIAELGRALPSAGRRLRAVSARSPIARAIPRRDLLAALRSPDRVLLGFVGLVIAAALFFLSGGTNTWLTAAGAVALVAGVGPMTDGLRHAAAIPVVPALFGVPPRTMAALHSVVPVLWAALPALALAVIVAPASAGVAAFGALLAVLVRIADARKPPMPLELLMPIPTAFGDASMIPRVAWAADLPLVVALGGFVAPLITSAPLLPLSVLIGIGGWAWFRWRR